MIFYNDANPSVPECYIQCTDNNILAGIVDKIGLSNTPAVDLSSKFNGYLNEGVVRIITRFGKNLADSAITFSDLKYDPKSSVEQPGEGIRYLEYCVFGDYVNRHWIGGTYPSAGGYDYEWNHLCWGHPVPSSANPNAQNQQGWGNDNDRLGLHCGAYNSSSTYPDNISTCETKGFIAARTVFNHTVKYIGEEYTNCISSPVFPMESYSQFGWNAPQLQSAEFKALNIMLATEGLLLNEKNLGSDDWKQENVEIPTLNCYDNFPTPPASGVYGDMTSYEKNRYANQLKDYAKLSDPNAMFMLSIIESTTGGIGKVGVNTEYYDAAKIHDLAEVISSSGSYLHTTKLKDYKIWTAKNITNLSGYIGPNGDHIEPNEIVIPVLFAQFTKNSGTVSFGPVGTNNVAAYKSNKESIDSIVPICKKLHDENNQTKLAVYTKDGGNSYIFSDVTDLRNLSTSGAVRGKVQVNQGDVIAISYTGIYILSASQVATYICPLYSNTYIPAYNSKGKGGDGGGDKDPEEITPIQDSEPIS